MDIRNTMRLPQPRPERVVEKASGRMTWQIAGFVDQDIFRSLLQHINLPGDLLFVETCRIEEHNIPACKTFGTLHHHAIHA